MSSHQLPVKWWDGPDPEHVLLALSVYVDMKDAPIFFGSQTRIVMVMLAFDGKTLTPALGVHDDHLVGRYAMVTSEEMRDYIVNWSAKEQREKACEACLADDVNECARARVLIGTCDQLSDNQRAMGELASNGVVPTVFAKLHCLKFFRNWIKRWWVYIAKAKAWISIAQLMTLYGYADGVVVHDGDSGMIVSQPRIVTPVVPDMFNDYKTGAYGHGDIRRPESIVCWRKMQGGGYFSDPGLLVVDAGGSRGEDGAIFWLKWGDDGMGGTIHDICGSRSPKWILQEVDRGRELGKPYDIVYYGNEQRPGVFLVTDNQGHQVRYFRFDLAIIDGTIRRDVQLSGRLVGSGTPALRGGTADESGLCQ
eukprot:gene12394-14643_t